MYRQYRPKQRRSSRLQFTGRDKIIAALLVLLSLLACCIGGWIAVVNRGQQLFVDDDDSLLIPPERKRLGVKRTQAFQNQRSRIVEINAASLHSKSSPFRDSSARVCLDSVSWRTQLRSSRAYTRRVSSSQGHSSSGIARRATGAGRKRLPSVCSYALDSSGDLKCLRLHSRFPRRQVAKRGGSNSRVIPTLPTV
jgi:hypothetical protein